MLIRTTQYEKLTNMQGVASAGGFTIRADGTGKFDRHHHTFPELWLISRGSGVLLVGDDQLSVEEGDIVLIEPGYDHDVLGVVTELRIFWVSLGSDAEGHLHRSAAGAQKHVVPVIRGHQEADD